MEICNKCKKEYTKVDVALGICRYCVSENEFKLLRKKENELQRNYVKAKTKEEEKYLISSTLSSAISIPISIIILVIVVYFFNYILKSGQDLYYKEDMKKCELLRSKADTLENQIITIEKYLDEQENKISQIQKLKKEIDKGSKKHLTQYLKLVNNLKSEMQEIRTKTNLYNNLVNEYNTVANKYNALSQEAYSRYQIVPMGIRTRK